MRIKWLHISDIHLNKTGTETRRMRMQLISYLKSAKVLYDYLFVTGDLRYAPNGVFDPETCTFLSDVMNAAHVRIENVFIIPGNHDIDRENFDRKIILPRYGVTSTPIIIPRRESFRMRT